MADKKKFILRKKSEKQVKMPMKEFVKEHKKLINVLNSPSHKDDVEEAKEQKKELESYTKSDVSSRDSKSKNLSDFIRRHNQKKLHKAEDAAPMDVGGGGTYDYQNATVSIDAGQQVGAEATVTQDLLQFIKSNITSEISKIKLPKGVLTVSFRDNGLYNGFFQDNDGQVVEKFDAQTLELIAKNLELKNWYEKPPVQHDPKDEEEDRRIARDEARQAAHESMEVHNMLYHKGQEAGEPVKGKKGTTLRVKFGDLEIELRKSVRAFVQQYKSGSSDEEVVQKSIKAWRKRMANVMSTSSDHAAAKELLNNWETYKEDFSQMVYAIKKLNSGNYED